MTNRLASSGTVDQIICCDLLEDVWLLLIVEPPAQMNGYLLIAAHALPGCRRTQSLAIKHYRALLPAMVCTGFARYIDIQFKADSLPLAVKARANF